MNELHDLLERATDRIESPDLAAGALADARRRRTTQRGVLAAGVAAVLVLVVALAGQLTRGDDDSAPSPVTPPTDITQPRWDPREVDDLPAVAEVSPLLPQTIEPPANAPALADEPIEAAVLSIDSGRLIRLLSTDGDWRSLTVDDKYAPVSLSAGGTRLLVQLEDELEIWDLGSGDSFRVPFPDRLVPWDYTWATWVDDSTVILDDYEGGWLIEVDTGSSTRVPYPTTHHSAWTVDDAGAVLEGGDLSEPPVFTDWAGGEPRRLPVNGTGRLARLSVARDTVIGTSYDGGEFRVVAADRSDLAPRAVLPVRDFEGNYSNWALGTVAVLDDGTVLLWVAVVGPDDGWRLVSWDPESGELGVAAGSDVEPTWETSFATDLLG